MEKFYKKISLEPYTTRFPLCYPSLKDGELYYFDPYNHDIDELSNYGKLPLGINETTICACDNSILSYYDFTQEMGENYTTRVLSFAVLQRWFTQMLEYRKKLYSDECHGKFNSMVDYYTRNFGVEDDRDAIEADELYIKHGGDNFYNWLIKNYFILLDLYDEYDRNTLLNTRFSYTEWVDVVKSIGTSIIYYPEALELYAKLKEWHKLYNDLTDCSVVDKCCDCVDYKLLGGDTMLEFLSNWVSETNERIIHNNEALIGLGFIIEEVYPTVDISVLLKSRMEDLGVYVPFAKEFDPKKDYKFGEVCIYDNDVWLKTNIEERGTPPDTWIKYSEYYYSLPEHSGETIERFEGVFDSETGIVTGYNVVDSIEIPDMSGRTSSSLDSFLRQESTIDNMGNTLPGHFRPFSASTVSQPAEGSLLGLMYQPGAYANTTILEDNGKASKNVYFGDFLAYIEVFCKDGAGDVIESTRNMIYPNDDSIEKIKLTISAVTDWNEIVLADPTSGLTSDGKIYADFTYYKGAIFTFGDGISVNASGNTHLTCTDHCILEERVGTYFISPTENYPIRYYNVIMDRETHYSEEQHKDVDVFMCDFSFKPSEFPPGYTIDQSVVAPNLRREEMLPFSLVENPVDNIYIDRGYATVLDRHLRICEISKYEQLEKYGNGIFQIYDAGSGDV